jgi:hypothetical protein
MLLAPCLILCSSIGRLKPGWNLSNLSHKYQALARDKVSPKTPDFNCPHIALQSLAFMFLTDGGETVRNLPQRLNPGSEHWLDWFHITMRLTVMGQMTKGIASETDRPQRIEEDEDANVEPAVIEKGLERTKWFLWHGNVYRALEVIEDLERQLESTEGSSEKQSKFLKAVKEFSNYIGANKAFIPNHGDRYRHGEMISTSFVESPVNDVVSKPMVKKQQMRWSERGAHSLLQEPTQVLDEDLRTHFAAGILGCKTSPAMRS